MEDPKSGTQAPAETRYPWYRHAWPYVLLTLLLAACAYGVLYLIDYYWWSLAVLTVLMIASGVLSLVFGRRTHITAIVGTLVGLIYLAAAVLGIIRLDHFNNQPRSVTADICAVYGGVAWFPNFSVPLTWSVDTADGLEKRLDPGTYNGIGYGFSSGQAARDMVGKRVSLIEHGGVGDTTPVYITDARVLGPAQTCAP